MPPQIYLDHNATAPILPEVADAVRDASLRYVGNPASQHDAGRRSRRALEAARRRIGEILGASVAGMDADQVIFTSGGTEANNLALVGLLAASTPLLAQPGLVGSSGGETLQRAGGFIPRALLILSAMEHASIARTADQLAANGCEVAQVALEPHGVVRRDHLEQLLANNPSGSLPLEGRVGEGGRSRYTGSSPLPNSLHQGEGTGGNPDKAADRAPPKLVSVILASNETGVVQPVAEIAALCRRHGALIHTDASQAVAKIPVSFQQLGVDALTVSAHKFHGPLGIGALVVRHGVRLEPTLFGGFQQAGLRPGTESVALAIGMQTALELWLRQADDRAQRMTKFREQFEREILAGYPAAIVVGSGALRLPHTSNIAFIGLDRQALVMALDLEGIACSTGSACASGSSEPSPTLLAMGLPEAVVSSALRFSLGAPTTAADMEQATSRILNVANRLRGEK